MVERLYCFNKKKYHLVYIMPRGGKRASKKKSSKKKSKKGGRRHTRH